MEGRLGLCSGIAGRGLGGGVASVTRPGPRWPRVSGARSGGRAGGGPQAGGQRDEVLDRSGRPPFARAVVVVRKAWASMARVMCRYPRRPAPAGHSHRQFGLGREPDILADAGFSAPVRVLDPGLGQVQLPVQKRPAGSGGIAQEHPDLTVLDPPCRASSTVAPPPPTCCPSSRSRSHRRPAHPRGRQDAPPRSRAGRHGPHRRPSPRSSPTAASRPGPLPRPARPASNRSCAPTAPATLPRRPTPAPAPRSAQTAVRSGHATPPSQQPTPRPLTH